jgi:glycosyltransferase involved in cell wall biosynthesis
MPPSVIAVLSHRDVSRSAHPRARRVTALLRALGREAMLFQPGRAHPDSETCVLPVNLERGPWPGRLARWTFRLPANRRRVRDLLDALQPGLVVLTSIWDYPAVEHLRGVPLALDAPSVEALRAERSGNAARARRVAERERQALRRVDHVFAATAADLEAFRDRYGVDDARLSLVPEGVDAHAFATDDAGPLPTRLQTRLRGKTVLHYAGDWEEPAHAEALVFLNQILLPELEAKQPGRFALLLSAPPPLPRRGRHPAWIVAGGRVDPRACLARADLCLRPLRVPTGQREEPLSCLAAGKALLCTPEALEGLPCANGVHAVIEDNALLAREILRLAEEPDRARALGQAGQRFVRAMHDWRSIQPRWQVVFNRLRLPPEPPS